MKEHPILFSAPMVRAILDGQKTQTRRVVTRNNLKIWTGGLDFAGKCVSPDAETFSQAMTDAHDFKMRDGMLTWKAKAYDYQNADFTNWMARSDFGEVGDHLWVRENFTVVPSSAYRMSEGVQQTANPNDPDMAAIYAAGWDRSIPKWKPSIHMPRWASRSTLEITDIRVERLQDISEADAADFKAAHEARALSGRDDIYAIAPEHNRFDGSQCLSNTCRRCS